MKSLFTKQAHAAVRTLGGRERVAKKSPYGNGLPSGMFDAVNAIRCLLGECLYIVIHCYHIILLMHFGF